MGARIRGQSVGMKAAKTRVRMKLRWSALWAFGIGLTACGQAPPPHDPDSGLIRAHPAAVDAARLLAANSEPGNWMSPGAPMMNSTSVHCRKSTRAMSDQLGLAWFYDLDTAHRGQESTPLVIDGVMYVTSAWSKVFALDAQVRRPLWTYDPKVPGPAAYQCLLRCRESRRCRLERPALLGNARRPADCSGRGNR